MNLLSKPIYDIDDDRLRWGKDNVATVVLSWPDLAQWNDLLSLDLKSLSQALDWTKNSNLLWELLYDHIHDLRPGYSRAIYEAVVDHFLRPAVLRLWLHPEGHDLVKKLFSFAKLDEKDQLRGAFALLNHSKNGDKEGPKWILRCGELLKMIFSLVTGVDISKGTLIRVKKAGNFELVNTSARSGSEPQADLKSAPQAKSAPKRSGMSTFLSRSSTRASSSSQTTRPATRSQSSAVAHVPVISRANFQLVMDAGAETRKRRRGGPDEDEDEKSGSPSKRIKSTPVAVTDAPHVPGEARQQPDSALADGRKPASSLKRSRSSAQPTTTNVNRLGKDKKGVFDATKKASVPAVERSAASSMHVTHRKQASVAAAASGSQTEVKRSKSMRH